MADVVVSEFVTLDGVFEDPGGAESSQKGGWAFRFDRGPDGDKFKVDETMNAGAMLLGRNTYEGFADAWPGATERRIRRQDERRCPSTSSRRRSSEPTGTNSTVIRDDVPGAIKRLRSEVDGDILVAGSGTLVRSCSGTSSSTSCG